MLSSKASAAVFSAGDMHSSSDSSETAADGEMVVIGSGDGAVYGFDGVTGEYLCKFVNVLLFSVCF